ncbi:CU044_2847 family protein [Catellatospora coxensis]|nr:CU044_2847 family protein [Catellatospora coxensis]
MIRVEVVALEPGGGRQISRQDRVTELLRERALDIEAAIAEAARIAGTGLVSSHQHGDWQVTSLEARFGLTLTAEAGVIVGKASTEACFEITLTVQRRE